MFLSNVGACRDLLAYRHSGRFAYSIRGVEADPGALSRAVTALVAAGAVADRDVYWKDASGDPVVARVLQDLEEAGLVSHAGELSYALTSSGMARVMCGSRLCGERVVRSVREDLPLEEMTAYELSVALEQDGWTWCRLPGSRAAREALCYTPAGSKQWYSATCHLCKPYMVSLLMAGSLFLRGVASIPHWHPQALGFFRKLLHGENIPVVGAAPCFESDVHNDGALSIPAAALEAGADAEASEDDRESDGAAEEEGDAAAPRMAEEEGERAAACVAEEEGGAAGARMVNTVWGPFILRPKHPDVGRPFGGIEAHCPFHRKSERSDCKKYLQLKSADPEHRMHVLWCLRHWCNQAKSFERQRYHVLLGDIDNMTYTHPAPDVISAQMISEARPARPSVKTDIELDREAAEVQPQAPGRGSRRGRRAGRAGRARGRGRSRGRGGGHGDQDEGHPAADRSGSSSASSESSPSVSTARAPNGAALSSSSSASSGSASSP